MHEDPTMAMIMLLQLSIPVLVKGTGDVSPYVNQLAQGLPMEDLGIQAVCPFGMDDVATKCQDGELQGFDDNCDSVTASDAGIAADNDELQELAEQLSTFEARHDGSDAVSTFIYGCAMSATIVPAGGGDYRWCCYNEAIPRMPVMTSGKGKKGKSPKSPKSPKGTKSPKAVNGKLLAKQVVSSAHAQARAEVGAAVAFVGMLGFVALVASKMSRPSAVAEPLTAVLLAESPTAEVTEVTALQM